MNIYTDSAIVEVILKVISTNKYSKIVESFRYNHSGTFLFNPLDDDTVNDIFLQKTEEFPKFVLDSIIWYLCNGSTGVLAASLKENLKIRLTPDDTIKLNEWSAKHEGIPLSAKCQIVGSLPEGTYTKYAECKCTKCGKIEKLDSLEMPILCSNESCSSRKFKIVDSTKITGDIKKIIIQELPEDVKNGSPRNFTCILKDDLMHDAFVGQRKQITGVFRSVSQKDEINKIIISTISLLPLNDDILEFPDEIQSREFQQLSKKENYLETLTESFAPEIKYRRNEKLAVILARIGGTKRIHVLLSGPSGTAKTQILKFLPKVTKRCGIAVGGTSSGVGITASMVIMPDKTKFVQAGLVSQCNESCVVLDELSLFEAEDLGMLYYCMSDGLIPYRKGGLNQELKADTTIVAGANPKTGYYEPLLGMLRNLNIPAPLISRFSIIYNVLPESSEIESQKISDHIKLIHKKGIDNFIKENNLLTEKQLLILFNHMKSLHVTLSEKAGKKIDEFYNTMMHLQKSGEQESNSKSIERRFYDSILSTSEAFAKLYLSNEITEEHAEMAISFIKSSLESFGMKTDKEFHQVSLHSQDQKDKHDAFEILWVELSKIRKSDYLTESEVISFLIDQRPDIFDQKRASKIFQIFHDSGDLQKSDGKYRMVK